MHKRVNIKVKGHVQGVFFRSHTQEMAEKLGLTGWVRNAPDGGVEIVVEGDKEGLNKLVSWSHNGPSSAHVIGVDFKFSDSLGEFDSFRIKYF